MTKNLHKTLFIKLEKFFKSSWKKTFIFIFISERLKQHWSQRSVPQMKTFMVYKVKSLWILRACLLGGMKTEYDFSHMEMSLGWKIFNL